MKKKATILISNLLLFTTLIIYSNPGFCEEKTINSLYVGGIGEGNFSKIQDAINNSKNGHTIYVYQGVYFENLFINKSINLIGEDKNITIIDGNGAVNVVIIYSPRVKITGFSIQNSGLNYENKGIWIHHSNHSKIKDNKIHNNHYGIFIEDANNNIILGNIISNNIDGIIGTECNNNYIHKNEILFNDIGMYFFSKSGNNTNKFNKNNTIIDNNFSENDDGIFITHSENCFIIKNNFSDNYHGIFLNSSKNLIYSNNFFNNRKFDAIDYGNNVWYNKSLKQGNYWNNYTGKDNNNNGIGDEPYEIPGANNLDIYPLMMPYDRIIGQKEFQVDQELLYRMLIIGMIVAIVFCLPIAYIWYRKYYKFK